MVMVSLQDVHITRKDKMKKLLILTLLLITPQAFAYEGYVSPESYAVNEADFQDYRYIPPSPKLNLEMLEKLDETTNVEEITEQETSTNSTKATKTKKEKKEKISKDDPDAYKRRISYKFAKWWVDQRYKREEEHHGAKHEIKIKAREEYEKRLEEQKQNEDLN